MPKELILGFTVEFLAVWEELHKIHSTPNDKKGKAGEPTISAGMIQSALHAEKEREEAERKAWFVENFDSLTLLDIYASEWIGEIRRNVIRDLLQVQAPDQSSARRLRKDRCYRKRRCGWSRKESRVP